MTGTEKEALLLENTLINYANAVAQRTFESMKALQDASIAIFNASLAKYQADLEAYKTKAAVYESRIRGELAKFGFLQAMQMVTLARAAGLSHPEVRPPR